MKRLVCILICLSVISVLCLSSFAADDTASSDYYETVYDPAMFFWNLAVQSQDYGGYIDGVPFPGAYGTAPTSSGSYSVPLDLDSRFNRLYYGANYNAVAGDYDYGATFKVVVTLTTVDSSEYSKVYPPNLYRTLPNGRYINRIDRESLSYDYTYTLSGGTHTFTFDNIPYDEIAGASFFYLDFNLSAFNSVTSNELYFINSYFGLSSYFDENKYSAETLENLNDIKDKLQQQIDQEEEHHEETKGLLGTIIDGIAGIPGKIKEAFNNLINEIKESVIGDISSAMNGFLEDLKDKLGILYQAPDYFVRIIEAIMTTDTSNKLTFPSMVIPVGDKEYTLNEPMDYQIFPDWIPDEVYTFINLAFSIVVIIAVINFADRKWEEITTNG